MAEFGKPGEPEMLIPHITQETLAEDDWHDAIARELLYESLSQAGID